MRMGLVFLVFVGGGVGSVARHLLATAIQRNAPEGFPFGTFFVNLIGCFAIGVVGTLGFERAALSPEARTFLMVGILGGFTTFSSFTWETLGLLSVKDVLRAGLYVGGSVVLGLLGTVLGRAIGRVGA